jgi:hypothetical protein
MRTFVLSFASLAVVAAAAPAAGKDPKLASAAPSARSACDAKYYDYLVGKNLDEARDISGSNYRVLPQGTDAGAAQPKRMTLTVDKKNQIVEVACG